MIRPLHFGFNEQTAGSNKFQQAAAENEYRSIADKARSEFDAMVEALRSHGLKVIVFEDRDSPVLPDAVFPNNWISTHEGGIAFTYPMYAPIRRLERRDDILQFLASHYKLQKRYSLEALEPLGQYLEGTGSMVLDRLNRIAYACLSPRTDVQALHKFSLLSGMEMLPFHAFDATNTPIYHTNVLMALGWDFVVCCIDAVAPSERETLLQQFENTEKELIPIDLDQMCAFAGNMLELRTPNDQRVIVLSDTAYHSLTSFQRQRLKSRSHLLPVSIPTIEKCGGGSARCMIAEIFLLPA
ncbi:MAG: amidinotransferase [Saprospiraceae bacterium]|nr:amidinotransferase [Saprospiraceae bacterium]